MWCVLATLGASILGAGAVDEDTGAGLLLLTWLVLLVPSVAISVRRLRDMAAPVWLVVLLFIPLIGLIIWVSLVAKGSEVVLADPTHPNRIPKESSAPPFVFDPATAGNFVEAVVPLARDYTFQSGLWEAGAGGIEPKCTPEGMTLAHEERARVTLWPEYRMAVMRGLADALAAGFQPAGAEVGPSALKMGWHVNPEKSDHKCYHYPIEARVALVRAANVTSST